MKNSKDLQTIKIGFTKATLIIAAIDKSLSFVDPEKVSIFLKNNIKGNLAN
jgi:hypothetical protein